MATLTTTVRHDVSADVVFIKATGGLDLRTANVMRALLLRCRAECPTAIVVDITECSADAPAALTVFPSVARHQDAHPLVTILLCGVTSDFLRNGGSAALGAIRTFRTCAEALSAAEYVRDGQQRVELHAQRSPIAPGLARVAVGVACDRWDLDPLRVPALLIISELVTNAVLHADGEIDIEAVLRGDYLHMRVHDESPEPPTPVTPLEGPAPREYGRGLQIVANYSTAWGYVVNQGSTGKVVWATLRVPPVRS